MQTMISIRLWLMAGMMMGGFTSAMAMTPDELSPKIVKTYAKIVLAAYEDSLTEAKKLQTAIKTLCNTPSQENLDAARAAWIAARLPYLQTEVFRFYEGPIDDEIGPEGQLNAWPLDEAYIDYVEGDASSGVIQNADDYPVINQDVLIDLNERDGEKNISVGYHAIEFLLWGQDLSTTGPGNRPVEDFSINPNADRRKTYLIACTELLVIRLEYLVHAWSSDNPDNYRAQFLIGDSMDAIRKIMTGLAMLSGFEMASERLLTAYDIRDQEEEHSCFSDTTHLDIEYDLLGIRNVWLGEYQRVDGQVIKGPGIKDMVASKDQPLAAELDANIQVSYELGKNIPEPFDQAILAEEDSPPRQAVWNTIRSLETQAGLITRAGHLFGFDLPITE